MGFKLGTTILKLWTLKVVFAYLCHPDKYNFRYE